MKVASRPARARVAAIDEGRSPPGKNPEQAEQVRIDLRERQSARPSRKFVFSKTAVLKTESIQMAKPTEEQIRVRAHELWEQAGKPEGREDEFWHQAEKELTEGATTDEKSQTFLE